MLLDVGLPRLDGYEVAKALRKRVATRSLRLIALTGYGQVADMERASQAGFDKLLVKPAPLAAIVDAIGDLQIKAAQAGTP